jgi:hypothetical protein
LLGPRGLTVNVNILALEPIPLEVRHLLNGADESFLADLAVKSDLRDASQAMLEVWDVGEHVTRDSPRVSGFTVRLSISAAARTRFDAHFSFDLLGQTSRERFRASDGRSELPGPTSSPRKLYSFPLPLLT